MRCARPRAASQRRHSCRGRRMRRSTAESSPVRRQMLALALLLACLCSACLAANGDVQLEMGRLKPLVNAHVAEQWNFQLPEYVLQQSFIGQGCNARLKQVVLKLLKGETVRIGALGGSVTLAKPYNGGFFTLLVDWLRKAFPKADIIARNGAISGAPSTYMERYMDSRLDVDVDLVLLEYTLNNEWKAGTPDYEDVRSYERILRRLLSGVHESEEHEAHPAAVLIVNLWRCCRFNGTAYTYMKYDDWLGDHYNILAQYYAVPSVAVRNGLYHAYRQGKNIFSDISETYPPNRQHTMTHPNSHGHEFLADIIIYAIYKTLHDMEEFGITQGDLDLLAMPQPAPLYATQHEVILGAWHDVDIQDIVTDVEGFQWLLEENDKGGYVSKTPGDTLSFKVSTKLDDHQGKLHPDLKKKPVVILIGLLTSYEHMGVAKVACIQGCSCTAQEYDTQDTRDKRSQTTLFRLETDQVPECTVQIEVSSKSTSPNNEHKVALRGVAVTIPFTVPDWKSDMPVMLAEDVDHERRSSHHSRTRKRLGRQR